MSFKNLIAILALLASFAVVAQVPGNGPVDPDKITAEELFVIATYEEGNLMTNRSGASELHYPLPHEAADCTRRGCKNGCTIGYGYNFGAHSAEKIRSDFAQAGISPEKTERFVPLANVTGANAFAICGSYSALLPRFPTLNRDESWALMEVMAYQHKQNVLRRARAEGILHFFNSGQFAILVALDYQNPVLSSRAKNLWSQLKAGDLEAVLDNIRNDSGTKMSPSLQGRRDWEARYFAWATSRQKASGTYFWPVFIPTT